MIEYVKGDIFKSSCAALVCPVNTMGVMGKGLALQFKKRIPGLFERYVKACRSSELEVGRVVILEDFKTVLLPTKHDWRNKSQLHWIKGACLDLANKMALSSLRSVAIPALGCGCGGLDWSEVKPIIHEAFCHLDEAYPNEHFLIEVYEP